MANRKNNRIMLPLFLLYFVLYAVSPLYHVGPVGSVHNHTSVGQKTSVSFRSAGIFFLEIVLSNFNDQEDKNNSTSRLVLFKKIRATIQSLTETKYRLARMSGNVQNQPVLAVIPFTIREERENVPRPCDGFLAFFSGLSPPFAQLSV
jgi:hypothetical protein